MGNDMGNSPYVRSAMAQVALELVPPLIRETLLKETTFREEYGFTADVVLVFGDSGISIQRSELFDAIRKIHSDPSSELDIIDITGRDWKLRKENDNGELPKLVISSDEQQLILPDFTELSPDSASRLRSFDKVASEVNLPTSAREFWFNVLSERLLEDHEVDQCHSDFRDTPVHISQSIRNEIGTRHSSASSLVPASRRYFERLVGAFDGSRSIMDYAATAGKQFFEQLSAWKPYEGFLFSLFLSSHSAMTAEIVVEHMDSETIVSAFDFLEKHGDRISQLGAIEVGLRVLPESPMLEPLIVRLIEQIRDDDVDDSASGFKFLSALFVLADGELSRTRLMSSDPPYYRRLASLSQAALIHRQFLASGAENGRFIEWAFNNRGEQYYMQSLVDMRLEPRWNPDLADAAQMKADFFGRIMIAAITYEKNINGSELHGLILGAESGSLHSLSEFPRPYFSGPLEGAQSSSNNLPNDLSEAIEAQLNADEVGPSSFVALVNSAMIFHIDSDQAELAAKALRLSNYRLANVEDKSQLLGILNGLSVVSATARNRALANELRILVRRYRRDAQYGLSIREAMRICLVASASSAEMNDWREFAGDCLTELAFGELEGDEGNELFSHLRCLCHAAPELWVSCSRADAALVAFSDR